MAAATAAPAPRAPPTRAASLETALAALDREGVVIVCWFMTLPWAIKATATREGATGWRREEESDPLPP